MDRQPPRATSDEIDLYIRTYYSLLRSSGDVRVRGFEEAHSYSESSLHAGAREIGPDYAAFAYSAARLPGCMPDVRRVVLGQSREQFEAAGLPVRDWQRVTTRGRRRPMRWDGGEVLACFVTSTTDIDDLVPILTAYQIEWNKMHDRFGDVDLADATLRSALGDRFDQDVERIRAGGLDLSLRLLSGSFVEYQRAVQRWWGGIEPAYVRQCAPRRPPVYFVSSNTHALSNLLGGYAAAHRDDILSYARERNPEGLRDQVAAVADRGDDAESSNLTYYLLHKYLQGNDARIDEVQQFERQRGIATVATPGRVDVSAQVLELSRLRPADFDERVRVPGLEALAASDAVIVNIDYPLGMAAYHHLSRLAQGVGELRGVYVMGKAATLNARVGDVLISTIAYDEHSKNTYLFRNCFASADVQPYARYSTVCDGQKALTVRGSFLQNRTYMSVFYKEGYTVLEMEAGPYLSAIYELVMPQRHPKDEIVNLTTVCPFDFGLLHYASDTPYSRRQSLLSKSLSYFGVDSTYACAIAIVRRILTDAVARAARA